MPWNETCAMDERLQFIADVMSNECPISHLCEFYGISRKTGYKWLSRYEENGAEGLCERSRAPLHHPNAVSHEVENALLEVRAKHPHWGPRKLLAWLSLHRPHLTLPCASTVGSMLRRHGLVAIRRRRARATPSARPLASCDHANAVWCADYKGWFRTGDGCRCDPLTISDAYSRYILRCQALDSPWGFHRVKPLFEATFREYGLPQAIRTDNGPPFASTALGGLSRLSVWWIRLGIRPERIRPGKPYENGRHERMHRTLKAECAQPPKATLRSQQCAFTRFCQEFNFERPHEALGQCTPGSLYIPSPRPFPRRLEPPAPYPVEWAVRKVKDSGRIKWKGIEIGVCLPLTGEYIGLEPIDDGIWKIYFTTLAIGIFDERKMQVKPLSTRRKRKTRNA